MAKKKVAKKEAAKKTAKKKRLKHTDGIPFGQWKINQQLRKEGKLPPSTAHMDGNQWWNMRSKHGRDKIFASPEIMWEAACEYFTWCNNNPLKEQKIFHTDGRITRSYVDKVRVYTIQGVCMYFGCNVEYLRIFKSQNNDDDFNRVIAEIEYTIYRQKFENASVDLLNANIISRDLGLADRHDVVSGGEKIEPPKINVYNVAPPLAGSEDEVK